jgi:hypothetical protein
MENEYGVFSGSESFRNGGALEQNGLDYQTVWSWLSHSGLLPLIGRSV